MSRAVAFTDSHAIGVSAPSKALLASEVRAFVHMRWAAAFARPVSLPVQGEGRPVLVLPGFMASDNTTARLRRSLAGAGFAVHGWGLGRNRGVNADMLEAIDRRVSAISVDRPVTIVGWSLGGLIAREYAKLAPDRVSRVITMGSPFSGDPRANNAWRMYERIAGHPVDSPPVQCTLSQKPSVPTIACWSARDGVVAPACARGQDGERDMALEFDCTHMAFIADPKAIRTIARLIVG
ncbi:alpha/beta hydrolase [Sphingobium sp. SCG-1]|uniref:esterase/lipase family protein n=1 Tax=Sphingobium sp. SCG-1 TaxID=2072936 RepID=UPI000CD6B385|nr:alpha/beta fold hydrolase [Sphingobium sp. SCG-1]AUW57230.1 alpha/beta hydrolase [Sphingobium sp. SCG-1]